MRTIVYKNINVTYESNQHPAIKDLSLTIKSGEIVSFIGASGCGKSTALNVAAGLIQPTSGTIKIDEKIIKQPGLDRGVVFQNYSLFPWMTNIENVRFALAQKTKQSNGQLLRHSKALLEQVGIRSAAQDVYPNQISGGMQQRVALARMFALDPPIFLMDEPFAAVDEITRKHLQTLLLDLWEKETSRKTILLVTHSIEEAIYLSDRVVVLYEGEIVLNETILFERPRDREVLELDKNYSLLKNKLLRAIEGKV